MFKDARELDRQRTASSFSQLMEKYAAGAEKWFDGTIASVDRRLDFCDRLLHSARFTVGRLSSTTASSQYLNAMKSLSEDRLTLTALRDDMLSGASDREDVSGLPGQRFAKTSTPSGGGLSGSDRRWVELESAKFVASQTDVLGDLQELSIRARHHAEVKTSTLTPLHSKTVTRAFVARVSELGKQSYVPRTVRTAAVMPDVAPEAMFL